MRRVIPPITVLLLPALLFADTSVPIAATEIVFDGEVIDLGTHRVVRRMSQAARCSMEDGPSRRAWSSPAVQKWHLPDLSPSDVTPHHVLLHDGIWSKKPKAAVVDRAAGKIVHRLDDRGDALVERPDGSVLGILAVDDDHHELRLRDTGGKLLWRRPIPNLWGNSAAVLLDGERLVIAPFHRIATGSALLAVDVHTGTPIWIADVLQLRVPHSKYYNDVSLARVGGEIVMRGFEAGGCYLQIFDAATGKRTFARMPR